MSFRQHINWTTVALGAALVIAAPLAAIAQNPNPLAGTAEPYTPAPDAKDLKAVLFNWMWATGMLKGHDERDMVATLEYQGKGTIQVDGQPCTLTKYRASTNYQTFSQRIQYTCTRANGQAYSNIEVVSGLTRGTKTRPARRSARRRARPTPMPAAVQERLIRIWASPQGAPKAAVAGTTETFWLGANPGTLFDDGVDEGAARRPCRGKSGKPVVTFPIPGVAGATATATLDAKYMAERVVVKQGATTTEFTYSDYQDWNNPLNKIDVLYAGKLDRAPERRRRPRPDDDGDGDGQRVCGRAGAGQREGGDQGHGPASERRDGEDGAAGRQVDAHAAPGRASRPDGQLGLQRLDRQLHDRRRTPLRSDAEPRTAAARINQTYDFELYSPSRFGNLGRPVYKPEYWDKVQQLDMWTNKYDPGHDLPAARRSARRARPGASTRRTRTSPSSIPAATRAADTASTASSRPTAARTAGTPSSTSRSWATPWALGGRHARARLHRVHRSNVARPRRLLPLRQDARRREVHASGRRAAVRRDG